jgi:2-polyprenyl-3-methyl-5-hydroxy-6-metoxy-1,4-benzoquinol methylase
MRYARELFETLHLMADLRCEDMFAHTFSRHSFDLVYSLGVIEHFNDPLPVVEIHTQLLKPGGVALITIPNYSGLYGWLLQRFAPESLAIHNMDIMSPVALKNLAPSDPRYRARSWPHGKLWLIR